MELHATIKELKDAEAILETAEGEMISVPARALPEKKVGADVFVALSAEAAVPARALLNEIIGNHENA